MFEEFLLNFFPDFRGLTIYSNKNQGYDPRLEWFKGLDYSQMSKTIDDLEKLLGKMKKIKKSGLEREIQETEEKLRKLKGE